MVSDGEHSTAIIKQDNHMNPTILNEQPKESSSYRRLYLLPLWIRVFTALFLLLGYATIVLFILGLTGSTVSLTIYGLGSDEVTSIEGLGITLLLLFKGVAAFGLWTERRWGIDVAIIEGLVSIIACLCVMYPLSFLVDDQDAFPLLRYTLMVLPIYIIRLILVRTKWLNATRN